MTRSAVGEAVWIIEGFVHEECLEGFSEKQQQNLICRQEPADLNRAMALTPVAPDYDTPDFNPGEQFTCNCPADLNEFRMIKFYGITNTIDLQLSCFFSLVLCRV
jgi:hypothetical protein